MFTVLFFLVVGTALGLILQKQKWVLETAEKATHWAVYLLLFLLGISVGANQEVMGSLATLGLQALLLSSAAISGSVISSAVIYRWYFLPSESPVQTTPLVIGKTNEK